MGEKETDKIHEEGKGAGRSLAWQRTMILGGRWFRPEVLVPRFGSWVMVYLGR